MSDTDDADDDAGGDGGLDRRGLLALGVVLAILAVCGVVLLTSGNEEEAVTDDATSAAAEDGDATTTVPAEETTTVDTSRQAVLEGVAQGLVAGSDGVISQPEAACMAEALVNYIGVERLVQLGDQARGTPNALNPLAALPRAEQDAAVALMLPCADAETRSRIDPEAR